MPNLVEPLTTALYTKLTTAGDFNTAMGGRIYFERYKTTGGTLPETYPYAVFFYVSDIPDYTFNTEKGDILVQVSIFDNAASAVGMLSHTTKLRALLDYSTLSITGWTLIEMKRQHGEIFTPDVNDIRQSVSTYRIQAQKT